MRAFISIELPENIKKEIKKIQNNLPDFIGKKTELQNLHLTLKFLGEIEEKKIKEIIERLKKIKLKKFKGEINEIGFFSPRFIRIIWLHLTGSENLQKEVDEALLGLFEKEKRFMSHLTIARVKKIDDKDLFIKSLKEMKIKNMGFEVDCFSLVKSELKREGPIYEIIKEFKLG